MTPIYGVRIIVAVFIYCTCPTEFLSLLLAFFILCNIIQIPSLSMNGSYDKLYTSIAITQDQKKSVGGRHVDEEKF